VQRLRGAMGLVRIQAAIEGARWMQPGST